MLVIPFDKKIDWRKPPLITLALIVINVLIYFSFQFNDEKKYFDAQQSYYHYGLAAIELPYFKQVLIEQGDTLFISQWESSINDSNSPWFFALQSNKPFIDDLLADKIITPTNSRYKKWKQKRSKLEQQLNEITTHNYSLKAGNPTLLTLISHMFLHGDFTHLIGNMIFLLAVGFIVELAMTPRLYLSSYLLCGIFSGLFYIPFHSQSLIPAIGASGAISGLMGMYALLFNIRKVRFFYFIYVYFDYVKLPAIYLLFPWLGYQIFQQLTDSTSNVNYLAHIGGLLSGITLIYFINKLRPELIDRDYLDENDNQAEFSKKLTQATHYMTELEFEKAVPVLAQLFREQPENREVLYKYYKASKINMGSEAHHHAAVAILSLSDSDGASDQLIIDTLNEYHAIKNARLDLLPVNNLIQRCLHLNALNEVQILLSIMQQRPQEFTELPQYLWSAINKLIKRNNKEKAKEYIHFLLTHYPNSEEAKFAQQYQA